MQTHIFDQFANFIRNRYNLSFTERNASQLKFAIQSRCQFLAIEGPLSYLEKLKQNQAEEAIFIDKIITGETCFFRYPDVYEFFMTEFSRLALLSSHPLQILHIGCSTGEEPYTIAMLLDQAGFFANTSIVINALDLNELAIEHAKRGLYLPKALRNTEDSYKRRYFQSQNNSLFELKPALRQKVNFYGMELFQLLLSPLKAQYDFIFCMNVMIYFDASAIAKLTGILKQLMHEETRLILAPTDSIIQMNEQFQMHREANCYWYALPQKTIHSTPSVPRMPTVFPDRPPIQFRSPQTSPQKSLQPSPKTLSRKSTSTHLKKDKDGGQNDAYVLGKQAYERKALEIAMHHFQQSIQQSHQVLECHLGLAKIFADQGQNVQAAEMAEYVLTHTENNDEAHLLLGILSLQAGDLKEAKKRFTRSLQLNPACSEAKNFLLFLNDSQGTS